MLLVENDNSSIPHFAGHQCDAIHEGFLATVSEWLKPVKIENINYGNREESFFAIHRSVNQQILKIKVGIPVCGTTANRVGYSCKVFLANIVGMIGPDIWIIRTEVIAYQNEWLSVILHDVPRCQIISPSSGMNHN